MTGFVAETVHSSNQYSTTTTSHSHGSPTGSSQEADSSGTPTINIEFTPSDAGQARSSPSPVSASKYIERSLHDLDELINQRRQELMELRKSHRQRLGVSPEPSGRRPPGGAGTSIGSSLKRTGGAGASREAKVGTADQQESRENSSSNSISNAAGATGTGVEGSTQTETGASDGAAIGNTVRKKENASSYLIAFVQ